MRSQLKMCGNHLVGPPVRPCIRPPITVQQIIASNTPQPRNRNAVYNNFGVFF